MRTPHQVLPPQRTSRRAPNDRPAHIQRGNRTADAPVQAHGWNGPEGELDDYLLGSYFYQPDHRLVFSAERYNGVNRRNPNKDRQR